ncbi:MAG: hypothetical protein JF617_06790 [Burkholderiales bacterium]|nr:hypothetical protein [Burkholderiales bacterium]
MEYRYWDWGSTPKRDDYQFALLTLALDKTTKDYGPYELTRVVRSYSTSRLRREINRGEVVNVHAGPWRPLETSDDKLPERSLRVNVPIFKDLLGYRKLLIRRDDLDRFQRIGRADDLKELVVGQANGWVDVEIYRHNGYRASRPELAEQLMLLPDITVYFPLPIIFYVNIHEPRMAERLEAGLNLARQDGSFERLFKSSFAHELQLLRDGTHKRFVLANPFVPSELVEEKPLEPTEPGAPAASSAKGRGR